ncbi:NUDIX domain-containing protein [Nitrospira sp. KM1]|uniref:NUDIX domain-containing protein n=1 Tax=Nitrospira sp. KM1 TaxID=1936990 RepID=UPI001563AB3E|nr:NUDIX hydrolase [Nitrospira sp. KM1]
MSKNIFNGKVITVNIDSVALPNGVTVDLEVVRHPGAAAVVPLKPDGTVMLVRQFRHAAGGFIYEIPAGKLYPGEDPQACASRELEEEIGYRAGTLELLSSVFTAPGFTDEVIHIYRATDLTKGHQHLDKDEVLDVVELSLQEAVAMIRSGAIRDAKTMVGLLSIYVEGIGREGA